MSKRINVNPDHYKVAGRERQGENVIHSTERRTLARLRRQERLIHPVTSDDPDRPMPQPNSTRSDAKPSGSTRRVAALRVPRAGISNRESPDAEARNRHQHPPVQTSSPAPEDAAGRVGEEPLDDRRDRHTSHKAGSRSIAQKEAGARYPDRSMPPARKVAGAFGREPQRIPAMSSDSRGAMRRTAPKRAAKGKRSR
jgi:hypothetical protein